MGSKLKSRRFFAWIVWTLLVGASLPITKTIDPVLVGWYGTITCLYIGSSVAKSYIFKDKGDE